MKPFVAAARVVTAALLFILTLFANPASAQSARELIVGAWTLVSADSVRPDGSKVAMFGPNPRGILIFSGSGQFALIQTSAELPPIAARSRDHGTPEEYKAIVQGSIAYFGSYSLNESDNTISLKLDGSTFANLMASGDQKRIITSLTRDELRFSNPRTPSGANLEVEWRRAR